MPRQNEKLRVYLKPKVRRELEALCRQGCVSAAKVCGARILLFADENQPGKVLPDREIAERVGLCVRQVVRIRQQLCGKVACRRWIVSSDRARARRPSSMVGRGPLGGVVLQQAARRSARWTIRLLADELGRLQIVTSVCPETVRQCLKKTGLSLGSRNGSAFRSRPGAVRGPYGEDSRHLPRNYDELHPLVCMDEAAKQITSDVEPALPMSPGQPRREDHHYQRKDVVRCLCSSIPCAAGVEWRVARDARGDWAEEVRRLLTKDYPAAKRVTLVCDNLNTHDIASLYTAFDAPTAHRSPDVCVWSTRRAMAVG